MVGADFIRTKSNTLKEILKLSKPTTVTILVLPSFPVQFPSLKSFKEEASRLQIDLKYFALGELERWGKVLDKLSICASESCWVVIEYWHLMPDCLDMIDSLNKVSEGFIKSINISISNCIE